MKKIFLQKNLLLIMDLGALTFTYWLSIQFANLFEPERLHRFDSTHLWWVKVLNALAIIVMFWFAELYVKRRPTWEELRVIYKQIAYLLIIDFMVITFRGVENVTYLFFFMFWALLFIILPIFRSILINILIYFGLWQRKIYIVGTEETALSAYHLLHNRRLMGYEMQAFVSLADKNGQLAVNGKSYPIISFGELLTKTKSCEVIVALDSLNMVKNMSKIFQMQRRFIFVSLVPEFDGLPLYGIEVDHFFGSEQLMLRLENNLNRRLNRLVKMIFDYVVVICFLPLLLPIMLIISVAIFAYDGGWPFFIQPRLGKNGKSFACIKFRSMHKNAETILAKWQQENSPYYQEYVANNFKLINDPRITPIGRILRKTSLDELAQLINVLKGEMSLVGPRPLLARELADYSDGMFYYELVRPGISGMWQVSGRSRTSFADRCRLDTWYIKNWALWYDVVILIKTIAVVVKREGAH